MQFFNHESLKIDHHLLTYYIFPGAFLFPQLPTSLSLSLIKYVVYSKYIYRFNSSELYYAKEGRF